MILKVIASGSTGNCYLLEDENEILILECGVSYKEILRAINFQLNKVVGCLVTHEHKDHSKSILNLAKNSINVYTTKGTIEALGIEENHRISIIESEKQLKIGSFIILPFETQHDAKEPVGFLIQHKQIGKLLFATDTYYIQYKFKNLSNILVECNYDGTKLDENLELGIIPRSLKNRLIKSHFSLDNCKAFFKANDLGSVRNIVLLHISDSNGDKESFKVEIERETGKPVYIAQKNLEIDLDIN